MKRFIRPSTILMISMLLIFISAAFSRSISAQSYLPTDHLGLYSFFQTTITPQPNEDQSEIGSTDGITVLSFVIVSIVLIPILLKRKDWLQS